MLTRKCFLPKWLKKENLQHRYMKAMNNDEIWQKLVEADWETITLRLLRYAHGKVQRHRWSTGSSHSLPEGQSPEDLVHCAIQRVFTGVKAQKRGEKPGKGQRRWDGSKELLYFLYDVIDSLISNLATSWDNKNVLRTSGELSAEDLAELNQTSPDKPQDNAEAEEFLLNLIDEIGDDPELTRLYDLFEQGYTKPAEIAQVMNLDATEVYQLKRKLRRLGTKIATTTGAGL
jgi:hypothetical protein